MPIAEELPIDTSATAEEMAAEIFGAGIRIESAQYFGDASSSGIYSDGDLYSPEATPGDTGVILSTGQAQDFTNDDGSTNTNTSGSTSTNTVGGINGDSDFNTAANGANTFDASYLFIEFEPQGDLITIDFVLSSEEYPEFVNSAFNDVVGVWVNGVPATVSIGDGSASIGNINAGETGNIYNDNTGDQFNTEMDGFTITLTFVAPVTPNAINTLKIGVADVGDSGYDTNLLIAGGSVQSTIVAQDDTITLGNDDTQSLGVLDNDSSTGGNLTITHINGQAVSVGSTVTLGSGQIITLLDGGIFQVDGDTDPETVYFTYTVEDEIGNTDTAIVEIEQVPCFVAGTLIDTIHGPVPVEQLQIGMNIPTRDGPPQPIRWIGKRSVPSTGAMRPIRIAAGQFGATRDLLLSPQHRILIADHRAELLFGANEVLIKAKDLINDRDIHPDDRFQEVTYFHLLFDAHQIIIANGVPTESYLPGPSTMLGFDAATQQEIFFLFPQLAEDTKTYGPAARLMLKPFEAAPLVALIAA